VDGSAADRSLSALRRTADRLEELADTAELMGDADGAARLRSAAWSRRLEAMALLDE
jgi:hypothetical protein